jgi:hypothetical protein
MCVRPGDPEASGAALGEIASSYQRYRREFSVNAAILRARHATVGEELVRLLCSGSANGRGR